MLRNHRYYRIILIDGNRLNSAQKYVQDTESRLYYLQSRYYDPEIGRFLNADAFASTGQGLLGNNMFAYCLNNPVVLTDSSGTAAHIGFSDDGQIHDAPWRIGSPGGGGWSQDIHYSQQDYGSVADKLYTVRSIRMIQNQITKNNEIKSFDQLRKEEFRCQQEARALKKAQSYISNPLELVDMIFREVGVAGTLFGGYASAKLISISLGGVIVLGVIDFCGLVWGAVSYAIKEVKK